MRRRQGECDHLCSDVERSRQIGSDRLQRRCRGTGADHGIRRHGNRFGEDSKTLRRLQCKPSALATEMGGAAVGYIRGLLDIPFVIIRDISDGARVKRRIPTSRRTSTRCDKIVTGYWRSSFPSREAFASYLVGSSDTSIITLPKFSPFKRPISVAGAFSIPATRCSLYFTRPSRTHWPISR